MTFSKKIMTYKVDGLGTITRELPEKLGPTDIYNYALVTVSPTGSGEAVVYFDDVYILQ
jgi:hypothetical protein